MSGKLIGPCILLMLAVSAISGCEASNPASMETSVKNDAVQLSGEYVRQNFDTEERLHLREDSSYEWTQLVLQVDAPTGYSHTGHWKVEQNEVLLTPDTNIPQAFKESLHYVVLSPEGNDVLLQKASTRYIDSSQLNRFVYVKVEAK